MSLESWNAGRARDAILAYLAGIEGVPAEDRVAVVDNDGTLWCEKPEYIQAFFVLHTVGEQAAREALAGGVGELVKVVLDAHAGLTTDEFEAAVSAWLADFRHPRFKTGFNGLVYAPMLELLELLREHGFRVFVVTGGGVDFVRPVATELYGVERDDVVGSAVQVEFTRREDGRVVLKRTAAVAGAPNEGPPKVVNIHAHIGRRPLVAIGNSAGDREMLEFAHTGPQPSLCLVVDHDDAEREYAYAGAAVTDPSAEPIVATAERFGWPVISIRRDWKRVFA